MRRNYSITPLLVAFALSSLGVASCGSTTRGTSGPG